ncbi:DUF4280 domain-containing protein [Aliikangiella coralliicola]|uniref:DUF4280 domain-containing protein n=1 Tax=Aliikangiella coralliicola TaxID=2592383 RepID=A0A545UG95_9GAMM|nr:DUF4280 domain-containing protein [Aliikangiella coralliicola]TQV88491.1 DUF4280 domain-containing protein [Aliikangiella coralliicola]
MPKCVCSGALMQCSFGVAPAALNVLPVKRVDETTPGANILDYIPITNIPTFGMCSAPTNPAVIAATSAALGVPTPAPCVPATATPWAPGNPTVLLSGAPILTDNSKLACSYAGVISINQPGQMIVEA